MPAPVTELDADLSACTNSHSSHHNITSIGVPSKSSKIMPALHGRKHQPALRQKCTCAVRICRCRQEFPVSHLSRGATKAHGTLADARATSHSRTPGDGCCRARSSSASLLATSHASRCALPASCVHCSTCPCAHVPVMAASHHPSRHYESSVITREPAWQPGKATLRPVSAPACSHPSSCAQSLDKSKVCPAAHNAECNDTLM